MRRSITLVARFALFANSERTSRSTPSPTKYQANSVAATPKARAVQARGSGRSAIFMVLWVAPADRIVPFSRSQRGPHCPKVRRHLDGQHRAHSRSGAASRALRAGGPPTSRRTVGDGGGDESPARARAEPQRR